MVVSSAPGLEAAGTERSANSSPGSRGCWVRCEVGLMGEPPGPSRSGARTLGMLTLLESRRERRGRGGSGEEGGPTALETRGERRGLGEGAWALLGRLRFRRCLAAVSSWRTASTQVARARSSSIR